MHKKTNHLPDDIANKREKIMLLAKKMSLSFVFISCMLGFLIGGFSAGMIAFILAAFGSYVILLPIVLSITVPFKYWGAFLRACNSDDSDDSVEFPRVPPIGGDVNDPTSPAYRFNRDSNSYKGQSSSLIKSSDIFS